MRLLDRLLGAARDRHHAERPLWHAVVGAARRPHWYRDLGVADTVEGRFDMVSVTLALVLLRIEVEPTFAGRAAGLTELFIEDMDAQLRQSGVGDLVVGKHIGKLMSALGGRLGALRVAFSLGDDQALTEVVRRNITLANDSLAPALAAELRAFSQALAACDPDRLFAGELP